MGLPNDEALWAGVVVDSALVDQLSGMCSPLSPLANNLTHDLVTSKESLVEVVAATVRSQRVEAVDGHAAALAC